MPGWVGPVASYMAKGFETTVELALLSLAGSILIGLALGVLYSLPTRAVRTPIRGYIELWRGLPLIVTLFFIFFALPALHIKLSAFFAAAVGFVLWGSAQVGEATRGAIQSIPAGQHQGAAALGLTWTQTQAHVILPQALRRLLPPLVSLLVNIAQNSTLASVLSVLGVLEAGDRSIARLTLLSGTSHAPVILGAVLAVFFIVCFPLTRFASHLERRRMT